MLDIVSVIQEDSVRGLGHKSIEVQSRAHPAIKFSGGSAGPVLRRLLPHGGEMERPHRRGSAVVRYTDSPGSVRVSPAWLHGQHGGPDTLLPPSIKATSVAPSSLFPSDITSIRHTSAGNDDVNPPLTVVVPVTHLQWWSQ